MATMDIIRMRARLTGTTGLVGSTVGCLSERARGSAAGLDSGRDSDSGDPDLVDMAAVASTAAAVRTVEVVRTAVDTGADTGKIQQ